jgi:GntR family transcriptional regulator
VASKFERIAADLRERVEGGEFGTGRLPAETDLAEHYGVALNTLRRAVSTLHTEGLIVTHQGTGTFVRPPRNRVRSRRPERYQWEKDRARLDRDVRIKTGATERDTGLHVSDLDFRAKYTVIPASESLAGRFDVPPRTPLLLREYWTGSKSETSPFSLVRSYLLSELAERNPELTDCSNEPWPGGTQSQLFSIGIEIDQIIDNITARPPTADEMATLQIDKGVAVIVLWKTSIDVAGRVVEVSEVIMPGDRTELEYPVQLNRWND